MLKIALSTQPASASSYFFNSKTAFLPLAPIHAPLPPDAALARQIFGIPGNSLRFDASVQAFTAPIELVVNGLELWAAARAALPDGWVGCTAAAHETLKESHHEADAHQRHAA
ncbi:MAG: hypothetical protein Q8N13_06625 [Acidovorax sp.]|nr:hypothetical protein [Acidovorax sp.]